MGRTIREFSEGNEFQNETCECLNKLRQKDEKKLFVFYLRRKKLVKGESRRYFENNDMEN